MICGWDRTAGPNCGSRTIHRSARRTVPSASHNARVIFSPLRQFTQYVPTEIIISGPEKLSSTHEMQRRDDAPLAGPLTVALIEYAGPTTGPVFFCARAPYPEVPMTAHDPIYITTTIPYVNARPHVGHALELVQADVLARHYRRRGHL